MILNYANLIFMKLKGQIAIITGAAGGIGKQTAEDCYAEGASIIVADINEQALEDRFKSYDPARVLIRKLNVTDPSDWEHLRQATVQKFGRIDLLFNIAGIIEPGYIHETSIERIDRQIDINLKGTIYGVHIISQQMVQQKKGHIINISSMAGLAPIPGLNIYSASKFGVRGFSLAVAQELEEQGVTISVVCPDAVDTAMLDYQKDKKEAAMTFSGNNILTAEDISKAMTDLILHPRTELWLPVSRGTLAVAGSIFPKLAGMLRKSLVRKGLKKQASYH